jgi:hypothetical protein
MADRKQDELDSALDAALAKYAAIEPRAGLEDRVLANLRAEWSRASERAWWRWGVAGALATVVVVALALALAWRSSEPSRPVVANHSSATTEAAKGPARLVTSSSGAVANERHPQASTGARTRIMNHVRRETVVAANPKLDQFPSPRPLSEQERILQSYVAENPEKAVLIARARSEALQRDLEELKTLASGHQPADSDEQNHETTER